MKRIIFQTFLLLFSFALFSQDHYRVLELEYEYAPNNRQENLLENSLDIEEYEANLNVPLPRENGDAILTGIGYNHLNLFPSIGKKNDGADTVMVDDHSYSRFRAQLGYSKKLDDERSLVFIGFFRIGSDMVNVTSDHYLYGGLALYSKKKSEQFTLKYGFYANTEHYGWLLIPLIGCDWQASDKLRIYGVLPRRLTLSWTMSDKFRYGIIWEAPNRSYRLSQNSVVKQSTNEPLDTYVQNIKNVVYAFGEVYLTKSLVLRGRVGYTLFREIELYEYQAGNTFNTWGIEYGEKRTRITEVPAYEPLEDGFILNASIEYRFSLP